MKITYLSHSGYMVEEYDTVLIFDYYRGRLPQLPEGSKVYVFASHAHPDHFNREIFAWEKTYPDIRYILSDDIEDKGPEGKTVSIGQREDVRLDGLRVRTFRSTDEGAAFLVYLRDKAIYHAGDLNWWHWEEEGEVYNEMMRRKFQHEIGLLEDEKIDAAFLPLDPRQEEQYYWGFDYFMRHTDTKHAFPMHMWDAYDICDRLLMDPVSEPYRHKVMKVTEPLQVFEV